MFLVWGTPIPRHTIDPANVIILMAIIWLYIIYRLRQLLDNSFRACYIISDYYFITLITYSIIPIFRLHTVIPMMLVTKHTNAEHTTYKLWNMKQGCQPHFHSPQARRLIFWLIHLCSLVSYETNRTYNINHQPVNTRNSQILRSGLTITTQIV